ncbi:MAG: tetratricopeptide repeat protein [Deltaproteobacteria bacterium]|nr:tetratricopeptide repeat protein [Deltaproteobacteria bacterium]
MDEELDLREALLIEAEQCLDHGDPEGALQSADEALAIDGRLVDAHHVRALALRELERAGEALLAAEAALAIDPDFAEAAFTRADLLTFELGEPEMALDTCDRFLREELDDTLYSDFLALKGNALCELGDFENALACFERATELSPERDDAGSRGWALFELGRMEEAVVALHQACPPGGAQNPANHFYLAVALSRLGDERGAASHFRIAARLDPEIYHLPRPFPEELIREVVEQARQMLPAALQRSLEGVPLQLEPWPKLEGSGQGRRRPSPLAMLRLSGASDEADEDQPEHGEQQGAPAEEDARPTALVVYERSLSFICLDRETMLEEMYQALWREIVLFLDLDEEEVEPSGLH